MTYYIPTSLICCDLGSRAPEWSTRDVIANWLARGAANAHWAVVDDSGRVWALRPTRIGALRIANDHKRRYHTATNHYAKLAQVVPISQEWLVAQAAQLRAAYEAV